MVLKLQKDVRSSSILLHNRVPKDNDKIFLDNSSNARRKNLNAFTIKRCWMFGEIRMFTLIGYWRNAYMWLDSFWVKGNANPHNFGFIVIFGPSSLSLCLDSQVGH